MNTKNNNESIISHFLHVGIGTIINVLLGLITTPIITRIVDPAEYGSFSVYNSYVDIILAIVFIGLDKSLIRFFYSGKDENPSGLIKICFITPVISSLVVFCIYFIFLRFGIIDVRFNSLYICLMLAHVLLTIWNRISTTLLRLTYKTKLLSICKIVEKIVYCLVIYSYILAIRKDYLLMLIIASIIPCMIIAIIATLNTKQYWNFKEKSKENIVDIFKYGAPFIIYSAMIAVLDSLDKFSIDIYCSEYDVGVYASGLTLVSLFLILKSIFETVWVPMQTEHYTKNPDDTSFIQKGSKYISIIMFFLGINIIMFKDLICFILGSKYRDASIVLPFLFLGAIAYSISDTTVVGIDYSKKSYLHSVIGGMVIFVNFFGNYFLVPRMGIVGAAIATSFSYLLYLTLRTFFSTKLYYIDFGIKKMALMFCILILNATLSTFINIMAINVLLYILSMAIFAIIYKDDIRDMINYLFSFVSGYINNKT